jgi:hypothetical protein
MQPHGFIRPPPGANNLGAFICNWSLNPGHNYFEVELVETGKKGRICKSFVLC